MAAAGVFRPAPGPWAGSFTSAVRDAVRVAAFGSLRFEGTVPPGSSAAFFVRAGNAEKPDGTWSEWVPVGAGRSREAPGRALLPVEGGAEGLAEGRFAVDRAGGVLLHGTERSARPRGVDRPRAGGGDVARRRLGLERPLGDEPGRERHLRRPRGAARAVRRGRRPAALPEGVPDGHVARQRPERRSPPVRPRRPPRGLRHLVSDPQGSRRDVVLLRHDGASGWPLQVPGDGHRPAGASRRGVADGRRRSRSWSSSTTPPPSSRWSRGA